MLPNVRAGLLGLCWMKNVYIITRSIGDVLASTLVMKLNDACREYMSSR